jgi:uncharacterized protein (TIGR02246 family)
MRCVILTAALALVGLGLVLAQNPKSNEEKAVRAAVDSYTEAFNKGDLNSVMAFFTNDADFIDDNGTLCQGKAKLTEVFKRSLADLKGRKLTTTITSLHFVRPDVATVDGKAELTGPDGNVDSGRFTSTWIKNNDKWLLCSVRDLPDSPADADTGTPELKELEWLVGIWAHQSDNFSVQLSGRWTLNKSFLQLDYTVKGTDNEELTVIQFFGWDPVDDVIHSWFFDSRGGYGGGDYVRSGKIWTSDWNGVLSEGRVGSSTNSIQIIDEKSFVFRSVDRDIDGVPVADVEAKFTRKTAGK